jgi:hypothetical protein
MAASVTLAASGLHQEWFGDSKLLFAATWRHSMPVTEAHTPMSTPKRLTK